MASYPTTAAYEDVLMDLVHSHADGFYQDLMIYSYDDPEGNEIRLVEVSAGFSSADDDPVWTVTFGVTPEVPYRSSVALVTPGQWAGVQEGILPLPDGWDGSSPRRVWPDGE